MSTRPSRLLRRRRRLRPRAAGIYLHHALALAETSRWLEAVLALQQAMALQPTNPVLPMFLGRIYLDHADYAKRCALVCPCPGIESRELSRPGVTGPHRTCSWANPAGVSASAAALAAPCLRSWNVASCGAVGVASPPSCSRPMQPCRVECCCTLKPFCSSTARWRVRWPSNYSIPRRRTMTGRLPTDC